MGFELPVISAILARLDDPEIHLAAYGGVVFPISLLIEAPIIMLLAASTALSKDWTSYLLLRRFTVLLAVPLTVLHILVAFTPIFDIVVSDILAAPEVIYEPARIGLMLMTPWTGSIALRRFQQGVLIRVGQSKSVATGTAIRLGTNIFVLCAGYSLGTFPGIVVATSAIALGVIAEALFVNIRVKPILRQWKRHHDPGPTSLTAHQLWEFYLPLAITPVLTLLALPIGSAALSRMPLALESLAVWPVVAGLSFTFRSLGLAYHEVVVAMFERQGAAQALQRFAVFLALSTSGALLIITATPLSHIWMSTISNLSPTLTTLGQNSLWLVILMPALTVMESWYQGVLVHSHQTKAITQAVLIYLLGSSTILTVGIYAGHVTGLYVSLTAMVVGFSIQTLWLKGRSYSIRSQRFSHTSQTVLEATD